jgi:hypothetical protein
MAEALHALEKLADAVDALATGSGRVRDRLFEASTYLTRVRPEDIPDEDLRRTFIGVMEDDLSYAQPLGDEGPRAAMTLGRADWFMPSFYHSVLLQLPHAVGPKGQGAVSHVRLQLAYCEVSTSQGRRPTGHPQLQYRNPRIRRAGGCTDRSLCSSGD